MTVTRDQKEMVRLLHDRVMGQRDYATLSLLLCKEFSYRISLSDKVHDGDWYGGFLNELETAFPDYTAAVEELVEKGDRLICRYTFKGTHQAPYLRIPATGMSVSLPCLAWYEFRNDLIHAIDVHLDMDRVKSLIKEALMRAASVKKKDEAARS